MHRLFRHICLDPRRLVRTTLLYGSLIGLAVYAIGVAAFDFPLGARPALSSVAVGMIYTFVMDGWLTATGSLTGALVPIRSRRAALVHVAVQSAGTLFSFALATLLVRALLGPFLSVQAFVLVALMALVAAVAGNGVAYLNVFRQHAREAERAAVEAELRALRAQVNPHFLFNALNSIASLIRTRPAEAEAVTEDLADLFRYSLRASRQPSVTLADELASVQLYLEIERVRFRDRLAVVLDVPPECEDARVPSLVLQPLVENAVKHGVGRTTEPCTVTVEARREEDAVRLRVTDTGPGFDTTDPNVVLTRGTGLANVRDRLRYHFGGAATLRLLPGGVEMLFPRHTESTNESPASLSTAVQREP